jgi:hypothetical protein
MLDIIAIHLDKLGICYNVIQGNIPPKKIIIVHPWDVVFPRAKALGENNTP